MPDAASLVGQLVDEFEPGAFVTKYLVIAEVINPEGKRDLWMQASDDCERWDIVGMLQDTLDTERADRAGDDEGDE